MIVEIIMKLISMVNISSVTSVQVLAWAKRVKALRTQTAMLDSLKETKDFDAIGSQNTPKVKQNIPKEPRY